MSSSLEATIYDSISIRESSRMMSNAQRASLLICICRQIIGIMEEESHNANFYSRRVCNKSVK